MKRIFTAFICLCIVLCGFSAFAQTNGYSDTDGHWAKDVIDKWSSYGIIGGYNGSFLPDEDITRGEFATIINRIFDFDKPAENTFTDLGEDFYTGHILCLNNRGIMNGFEGKIRPDDSITREEAGTMLYKALGLKSQTDFAVGFRDEDDISDWARQAMVSLVSEGYFKGDNGYLRPGDNITRAEVVTLLDNGIIVGSEKLTGAEAEKAVGVAGDNICLKDCSFGGDVFVGADVESVVFENVTVKGRLNVLTDTDKAVSLKNSQINELIVENENTVYTVEAENKEADTESVSEDNVIIDGNSSDNSEITDSGDEDAETDIPPIVDSGEETGGTDTPVTEDEETQEEVEDVPEELKPTIETTLEDTMVQKNSKMVFDVIARDVNGDKIECKVRCNDINIEPSWDDDAKTSFLLEFTESGEYTVEITATDFDGISQTKKCIITYEMAEYGEPIGKATVSVEAFTVGGGYIVAPVEIDVLEGVNAAYTLDSLLTQNGLSYMSTGSLDGGFYLASVTDIPEFAPVISETLLTALNDNGYEVDTALYTPGQLSEFDFTQGSGWMYCVNGVFPNVGFSEYYLQDGDVVRIQFTLAYGSDIGGASGAGAEYAGDFYEMVNRDELTRYIASVGVESVAEHMELISKPDLSPDELDSLMEMLQ